MPTYSMTPVSSFDYSSQNEVLAFTRHLLDGQSTFNSTTRPTSSDVTKFLQRCSGVLNTALQGAGFATPLSNSTAKLACDDWATVQAVKYVELTQRGTGYSDQQGSRTGAFAGLYKSAGDFVKENTLAFKRLGCTVLHSASEGLLFTGQSEQSDRTDPYDPSLQQPRFAMGMFDNTEDV